MRTFIFMGTPEFAKIIVESLCSDDRLRCLGIISQPDRPVGRKQILTPPAVAQFARDKDIPLFQPEHLDEEIYTTLQDMKPDFIIVAAFGQLLHKPFLELAPCINLHTSLLPAYRGASPLQETLLNGDPYAGITAIRMDEGLDTGDILGYTYHHVPQEAKYECFLKKLGYVAANLAKDVMLGFDAIAPYPQRQVDASKVKKHRKEEGLVTFSDAQQLKRKYAAFFPWPGVYLESGLKLKELEIETLQGEHQEGEILSIDKTSCVIGCRKGALKIHKVQPTGKNEMDMGSYLRGKRMGIGDLLV